MMDDLQARIATRLTAAFHSQESAGIETWADFGLAMRADEDGQVAIRLSVTDVARIAADEARAWF